jgi:hypothetical protein
MERTLGPDPREDEGYYCVVCQCEVPRAGQSICRGCLDDESDNVELCPAWSGMCEGKLGIACVGGSALMGRVSPSCIPSMRARGGMMETRFDSGSVHNQ